MHIAILHNQDADLLDDDPGRAAREDVLHVAAALAEALTDGTMAAELLPVRGASFDFLEQLQRRPPGLVLNLCESLAADARGEMAIPCLLDALRLPYTGSDALGLGLALHKERAKALLRAHGVPTPAFACVQSESQLAAVAVPFPAIVKPAREDASTGIAFDSVVHSARELERAVRRVWETLHQPALVEQFIPGREIYVPLLGNGESRRGLPLSEIAFGKAFEGRPNIVSYAAKWEEDSPEFADSPSVPCQLPPAQEAHLVEVARAAFEALGCRDYGRVDLRVTAAGEPYVIDINPNCDLHPRAGYARAAAAAGMDYRQLAGALVAVALERHHGDPHPRRQGPSRAAGPARTHRHVQ